MTESSLLTSETGEEARTEETSTVLYRPVQTETPEPSYGSSHAGLVIGILLTVISLLIGAILYVVYQVRRTLPCSAVNVLTGFCSTQELNLHET